MAESQNVKPGIIKLVVEVISLTLVTLTAVAVFTTSGLAGASNAEKYGFLNSTGAVSDKFYTQITPKGYAFSIWGVIYTWDILWILYAWTFLFRPHSQRTIYMPVYWLRTIINCLNVTWIYIWGNEKIIAASVILYIFTFTFYTSNVFLVIHFNKVMHKVNKVDKVLTYILPINGMFVYTTWVSIASQLNLTIALTHFSSSIDATNSATIGLTLLLAIVIGYFILESTIGERYLRYVFSVYPVIIWASIAVLVAHWNEENEGSRNKIYVLVILIIAIIFLMAKIFLCIVCGRIHPSQKLNLKEHDKLKDEEPNLKSV